MPPPIWNQNANPTRSTRPKSEEPIVKLLFDDLGNFNLLRVRMLRGQQVITRPPAAKNRSVAL